MEDWFLFFTLALVAILAVVLLVGIGIGIVSAYGWLPMVAIFGIFALAAAIATVMWRLTE